MGWDWALLDGIYHVYLRGALTNAALIVLQEVEVDRLWDLYHKGLGPAGRAAQCDSESYSLYSSYIDLF